MKLSYSLEHTGYRFFPGQLEYPEMDGKRIKFTSKKPVLVDFPYPLYELGEMFCSQRDGESAVTLCLTLLVGTTPPDSKPDKSGWSVVPNADIRHDIWVPLPGEVAQQIREGKGDHYQYELTMEEVELVRERVEPSLGRVLYRISMTPLFESVATHGELAQRSLELEFPESRENEESVREKAFSVAESVLVEHMPRKDIKKWSYEVAPLNSLSRAGEPDAIVNGVKAWLV